MHVCLCVALLCLTAVGHVMGACSDGWTLHGGACYKPHSDKVDWQTAHDACEAEGATLATAKSAEVNQFLFSLSGTPTWLNAREDGLGNADVKLDIYEKATHEEGPPMEAGQWLWVDTQEPLVWTHWAVGEPNNAGGMEHCMQLYNGEWVDQSCVSPAKVGKYVCVKEISCTAWEFKCTKNGKDACIKEQYRWDGVTDCDDGSDEVCDQETHFLCETFHLIKCLPNSKKCDGVGNCNLYRGVPRDEYNCPEIKCEDDHFKCISSKHAGETICVKESMKCDGYSDCEDDVDEQFCPPFTCPEGQFHCMSSGAGGVVRRQCFDNSMKCDGFNQCNDFSDEENCGEIKCQDNAFKCMKKNKERCVNNDRKCDGLMKYRCDDWDEDAVDCTEPAPCPGPRFKCKKWGLDKCVANTRKCDGFKDCDDGSDEADCAEITCTEGRFICPSPKDGHPRCIKDIWKCDGYTHCALHADETDCEETVCGVNQFKCTQKGNDNCIQNRNRLDGTKDCDDGSDEAPANKRLIMLMRSLLTDN